MVSNKSGHPKRRSHQCSSGEKKQWMGMRCTSPTWYLAHDDDDDDDDVDDVDG